MRTLFFQLLLLLTTFGALSAQNCPAPLGLVTVGTTADRTGTVWQAIQDAEGYTFEWRPAGAQFFTSAQTITNNYNLLGLTICSNYEIRVRAKCPGGVLSDYSAITAFSTNCTPNCDPPFAQFASQITDTTATLSWSTAGDGQQYLLRYRASGAATWMLWSLDTTAIHLGDLSFCTQYEFQTAAICGTDTSSYGGLYKFKTYCDQCEAPTGIVSFDETQTDAKLVWKDAAGASSYALRWREMGQTTWQSPVFMPSNYYVLDDLEPCKTYEYELRTACGISMLSDWSFSRTVTTLCSPVPCGPITSISLDSIDHNFLNISWDSLPDASSYVVQFRATDSPEWISLATLNNGFVTVPNLNSCTPYEMRVQTICGTGTSIYSDTLAASTACYSCDSITGVAAAGVGFQSADIVWSDLANSEGYILEWAIPGANWNQVSVQENYYHIGGLASCTDYILRVKNVCIDQDSPWSDTLGIKTLCCTTPTGLNASTIDFNAANLSWSATSNGLWLMRYRLAGTVPYTYTMVDTNVVPVLDLMQCATYSFSVASICNTDTTAWSADYMFTTSCCLPVVGLGVQNINYFSAKAVWTANGGNTGWYVFVKDELGNIDTTAVPAIHAIADSLQLSNLQPCTAYKIWVIPNCTTDPISTVDTVSFTTRCCSGLENPSISGVSYTSAKLNWTGGTAFTNIKLHNLDSGQSTNLSSSTQAISFSDLSSCTRYAATLVTGCGNPILPPIIIPDTVFFTTKCCLTPSITLDTVGYDFAEFNIGNSANVDMVSIVFSTPFSTVLLDFSAPFLDVSASLDSCTSYIATMNATCGTYSSSVPVSLSFMTLCTSGTNALVLDDLKIFPNPANSTVQLHGTALPKHLKIWDQWGRLMYANDAMQSNGIQLDVSTFASGVYAIQLSDERGVFSSLIHVQH